MHVHMCTFMWHHLALTTQENLYCCGQCALKDYPFLAESISNASADSRRLSGLERPNFYGSIGGSFERYTRRLYCIQEHPIGSFT